MKAAIPKSRKMMTRSQMRPIPTSSLWACRSFASWSNAFPDPAFAIVHQRMAHDSNHMADPYLRIYQPALTKEISHAPIVLEGGPCWCCPHRHDRLRGRANDPRTNAAGADAPGAD